jgi:F-type H+-transporting ATPase subunit b
MKPHGRRQILGVLATLGLVLWNDDLWASSSSGNGIPGELFWQLISFILLVLFLVYALKKPIRALLIKRREEVKTSLEQAAQKEGAGEKIFKEWEAKLNSLSQQIQELHQSITREGEGERKKIVERAKEEGGRITNQAQIVAEQEIKRARFALKKDLVDLAVEHAETLLKQTAQPADQERLVKEYIGKVREIR